MTFLSNLTSLKSMDKSTYAKTIAKDQKKLPKAKGILVMDDYKFSNGKAPALIFTPKSKEAKDQYKIVKEAGHPTTKMARGTCKYQKGADGNFELSINFLEGGLAPESVKTACKDIFDSLKVKVNITNIPKSEAEEQAEAEKEALAASTEAETEETEETEVPAVKTEVPAVKAEVEVYKNDLNQLLSMFGDVEAFVNQTLPPIIATIRAKQMVTYSDYELLETKAGEIRNWVSVFNGASKETKQSITSAKAVKMKEFFITTSQVKSAALRFCPEAQAVLDAQESQEKEGNEQTTDNNNSNNTSDNTNPNTNQPGQDQTKGGDKQQDKDKKETASGTKTENAQNNTAPAPPKALKGSVGNKGLNQKEDVINVQKLLNALGYGLVADGACGQKTIAAIADFQKKALNTLKPDGRIDPGGKTWQALVKGSSQPVETLDTKRINAAVGSGCPNALKDVKVVQTLLQKAGYGSIVIDGLCGNGTIGYIKDFQKNKMKMPAPDGKVMPDGLTFKSLLAGKVDDTIDLRDKDEGKYDYTRIAGDLFAKGNADDHEIDETDVQQGQIGDCYFMSAVAAVAKTNPEALRKLIKANTDGSYDVTLYSKKGKLSLEATIVNVKPDFVTDKQGNAIYAGGGDKELWVMLLEKAYAKQHGGYDDIGEGGYIEEGMEALTGVESNVYMLASRKEEEVKTLLQSALAAKKPITAASQGSGEVEFKTADGVTVYKGHAYSVESLTGDKIFLRNPWGHDHATLTVKEFKAYFNHFTF